jgi:ABC-type Na+ efflux pump permease subunit
MSQPENDLPMEPALVTASPSKPAPTLAPLGDYDTSILSHLGLPFYYRHTPTRQMRRATIWSAFIGIIILVMWNVLYMPYDKDTVIYAIRDIFFGGYGRYQSLEEGAQAIFNQCFVISIILSGVIAPLFASFSFSSERIMGTMEFLRLSPMSTVSIVMGKMFAPVYTLHLISFALLGVGGVFGLCGGHPIQNVSFAIVCIIATSAIFHAMGVLLAILVNAFRGFGAVLFLFLIGWAITATALAATRLYETSFIGYLSPWGMMENLFWEGTRSSWSRGFGMRVTQETLSAPFAGSTLLLVPYVMFSYALTFGLLLWASSRKLERSERPGLPLVKGWMGLWLFITLTAFTIPANFSSASVLGSIGAEWIAAAVVFMLGISGILFLAIIDHPHQRELVLTEECEAAAGHEKATGASWKHLKHALWTTGLVMVSTLLYFYMAYHGTVSIRGNFPDFESSFWNAAVVSCLVVGVVTFIAGVIFECAWVRFETLRGRVFGAIVGMGIMLALVIAFSVHLASAQNRWNSVFYHKLGSTTILRATQYEQAEKLAKISNNRSNRMASIFVTPEETSAAFIKALASVASDPEYSRYVVGIKNEEDLKRLNQKYQGNAFLFFWDFHTGASLIYIGIVSLLVWLLFWHRKRVYAALRKEAQKAIQPAAVPVAVS